MSKMRCERCGKLSPVTAAFCPRCGRQLRPPPASWVEAEPVDPAWEILAEPSAARSTGRPGGRADIAPAGLAPLTWSQSHAADRPMPRTSERVLNYAGPR